MALVVETGAGLANAESYASVATCTAYAEARGLAVDQAADIEAALRRATAFVDTYRGRFQGIRYRRRDQALEWPRSDAWDQRNDQFVPYDAIPIEIVQATCEAAVREAASPGSLSPDLTTGIRRERVKAGTVETETEYTGAGLTTAKNYTVIEGILAGLLGPRSMFSGMAVRG